MRREADLYHVLYQYAQPANLVGRWEMGVENHMKAVEECVKNSSPRVLYCGTAINQNPRDTEKALKARGYKPQVVTADISRFPLRQTDNAVQANAAALPFRHESFDIITTDFLLNMMSLEDGMKIIQEWSRVLKDDGVITTTVFLDHKNLDIKKLYKRFLQNFAGKHFFSEDALSAVFQSAGLETEFCETAFSNRPLLYHSDSFFQLSARKISDSAREKSIAKSKQIVAAAQEITGVLQSVESLTPRRFDEVVSDLTQEKYSAHYNNGKHAGFGRRQQLTDKWVEIGSLYTAPEYRGQGICGEIVDDLLALSGNQNVIVISGETPVEKILQKREFERVTPLHLPFEVAQALVRDRFKDLHRGAFVLKGLFAEGKGVWVKKQKVI